MPKPSRTPQSPYLRCPPPPPHRLHATVTLQTAASPARTAVSGCARYSMHGSVTAGVCACWVLTSSMDMLVLRVSISSKKKRNSTMLMSTLENFGGATSCRCHEHFNARFSKWHWRGHLVQRGVEVKDGAQRVYVLPHDFAGLSNLQTAASFRDFPVASSDRNSAATYFHFTFKRAFSKKLAQSQNAEHQNQQHTESKQARA